MSAVLTPDRPLSPTAWRIGHVALGLFVLGAALVWFVDERAREYAALALSVYAAMVVSFLGGIHWGIGFSQAAAPHPHFGWGAVPPVLAWVAVMMPAHAGLVLDAVMMLVCYMVDRKVYPALGLTRWLTLRFRISVGAAVCCFLGAAGV